MLRSTLLHFMIRCSILYCLTITGYLIRSILNISTAFVLSTNTVFFCCYLSLPKFYSLMCVIWDCLCLPAHSAESWNKTVLLYLQVPVSKEQNERVGGVHHVHTEAPVHRERPSICAAASQLSLVPPLGGGRVRACGPSSIIFLFVFCPIWSWTQCCLVHIWIKY